MAEQKESPDPDDVIARKKRNREEALRHLEEARKALREAEIAWAEARAYRKAASL